MIKAIFKSIEKSREIRRISKLYLEKNNIEKREIAKFNLFFDTSEITNKANKSLLDLIHKTSELENILKRNNISDEDIIDLQAFLSFMGGTEFVKGHMMIVSPFCFPQTLNFMVRNKANIRKDQNYNMEFYMIIREWFNQGSTHELVDI